MQIGNKKFDFANHTYIMGILNLSEDSFCSVGRKSNIEDALNYCEKIINDGADIIDIGAQSTKPSHQEITPEEEIHRFGFIVTEIKKRFDIPISIDTYKYQVADKALQSGAHMINDVYGLSYDEGQMADLIKHFDIPVCIMHNNDIKSQTNCIDAVIEGLNTSLEIAKNHSIKRDKIIIDPGICFGKTVEQNLDICKNFSDIQKKLNLPILLGFSNKSFIRKKLGLDIDNMLEANLSLSAYATMHGASIIRVHNVKETKKVLSMIETIKAV